jgi:hypothetical protein
MTMNKGDDAQENTGSEEIEHYRRSSRKAAVVLASVALRAGAQSPNATGKPLDPCGLDVVIDELFGEETYHHKDGYPNDLH